MENVISNQQANNLLPELPTGNLTRIREQMANLGIKSAIIDRIDERAYLPHGNYSGCRAK